MRFVEPTGIRYVRPVRPLDFPASDPEWDMGESKRHQLLCDLLKQVLAVAAGASASIGSDQFIYFDASNPKRKCAPDAFVKLDVPDELFPTWRTWEKGTPELCVEILSPSDTDEKLTLDEKLARFHTMGVAEVVAFDVEAVPGRRIRAWDLVEGDLVERVVENESTPCRTLGLWFVIRPSTEPRAEAALRLAEGADGERLILSPLEASMAREQAAATREQAATAEIARLRAELEGMRSGER